MSATTADGGTGTQNKTVQFTWKKTAFWGKAFYACVSCVRLAGWLPDEIDRSSLCTRTSFIFIVANMNIAYIQIFCLLSTVHIVRQCVRVWNEEKRQSAACMCMCVCACVCIATQKPISIKNLIKRKKFTYSKWYKFTCSAAQTITQIIKYSLLCTRPPPPRHTHNACKRDMYKRQQTICEGYARAKHKNPKLERKQRRKKEKERERASRERTSENIFYANEMVKN